MHRRKFLIGLFAASLAAPQRRTTFRLPVCVTDWKTRKLYRVGWADVSLTDAQMDELHTRGHVFVPNEYQRTVNA